MAPQCSECGGSPVGTEGDRHSHKSGMTTSCMRALFQRNLHELTRLRSDYRHVSGEPVPSRFLIGQAITKLPGQLPRFENVLLSGVPTLENITDAD
jgi:hypothetical protein